MAAGLAVLAGHGHVSGAHEPVLADRVVELLAAPGEEPAVLVDCTIGAGGHAAALMAASGSRVHLVGFDRDADALALASRRLAAYAERTHLLHAGYDELERRVEEVAADAGPVLGILYDLGVSSMQLDAAERGFSLRQDAPLDMRMDQSQGPSAADLVNTAPREELAGIIRRFGEERYAGRIAAALVRSRPLETTAQLAEVVSRAVPARARHATGLHPATRTFQALRIAVNAELDRFSASLPQALELTAAPAPGRRRGGRIAVLSYHSLEDRIAKQVFADAATGCICPPDLPVCGCGRVPVARQVTRGAERPAEHEIAANPRARAAKLRAVEKV